ncbi:unnamed protein product [Gordionus sp. m RMFG-2023]
MEDKPRQLLKTESLIDISKFIIKNSLIDKYVGDQFKGDKYSDCINFINAATRYSRINSRFMRQTESYVCNKSSSFDILHKSCSAPQLVVMPQAENGLEDDEANETRTDNDYYTCPFNFKINEKEIKFLTKLSEKDRGPKYDLKTYCEMLSFNARLVLGEKLLLQSDMTSLIRQKSDMQDMLNRCMLEKQNVELSYNSLFEELVHKTRENKKLQTKLQKNKQEKIERDRCLAEKRHMQEEIESCLIEIRAMKAHYESIIEGFRLSLSSALHQLNDVNGGNSILIK